MKALRNNPHLYMLTIVAIILSFMVTITPLWAKSGSVIQICSTLGIRAVTIDEKGTPLPPTPRLKKACAICLLASADITATPDFKIANYFTAITKKTTQWHEADQTLKSQTTSNYSARAPPKFS